MAEDNALSKKEAFLALLKEKYPDKEFVDEEEIYGQALDDHNGFKTQLEEYEGNEQKLRDMMTADPRSAQFLTDMYNGKSPWANYIRIFGPELKDSLDDPETIEQIKEAEREYVERVARNKELEAEYEQNIAATQNLLQSYQEEKGLSEEQMEQAVAVWLGITKDSLTGKLTQETLDMIIKAINYDQDIEQAAEEGEIAGRNAKIIEKLKKRTEGDGTMPLGGKNGAVEPPRRRSIFDLAAEAQ